MDPTSFILFDAPGSSYNYILIGGTVTLVNSAEVDILVTLGDLAAIRSHGPLASSVDAGYLSAAARAGKDMVGPRSHLIMRCRLETSQLILFLWHRTWLLRSQ